jgi:DNA-binding IclR family transcriptional regulator
MKSEADAGSAPAARGGAKPDRQFVTALARGLEILRCFNANRTELGTMEIASITGLPQPTVWRLCHTLLRSGYLAPSPSNGKLRIGVGVLGLGYAVVAMLNIGELALHEMHRLVHDFHVACSLAAPDRTDMLIVQRAHDTDSMLVVNLHVGSRLPMATSSVGWAFLAKVPEPVRAALLRELEKRYAREWPELRKRIDAAIEACHRRGYVLNGRIYHRDINAIAVPIVSDDGSEIYAVNCGGPAATITVKKLEKEIAPRLIELAGIMRTGLFAGQRR